ncbi:MAG: phosphoenolpyruvate---glycerone phosphotransferase subunit DhaL, partial [Gaiellales bacterium]|nr:phosphoenolpyruvate---glycerone phosphotransferase subunit DhaL [Gaiellales bacterium]
MGRAGQDRRAALGRLSPVPATAVTAETLDRWLRGCAAAIAEQRDFLTQLDAAIGDADHGANMTRGFAAVQVKLDDLDGGTPPGKLLIAAGSTLVSTVGGASGPLWGSGLRKAGRRLGDVEQVDPAALVEALEAALAAIVELGAAERG